MAEKPICVLIADDHPIVRQGLEILINAQPDMRLIGQAADGNEALRLIKELKPDVIVMDLKMPVKDGLSTIRELKKSDWFPPILVLTSFTDDEMLISAVELGVNGVMLKDAPPEQLLSAIRDVAHGRTSLHPLAAHKLMQKIQQSAGPLPEKHVLTDRELDVLRCLAQGMSNNEIALNLSISTRTVTTHVRNLLNKLGLDNRTQAALYAVEHKIVDRSVKN
ncbi:MAG: response regulator [Anaerolineales bacterium]|jgi:DNA-binding NarL/FixJ family response regulator